MRETTVRIWDRQPWFKPPWLKPNISHLRNPDRRKASSLTAYYFTFGASHSRLRSQRHCKVPHHMANVYQLTVPGPDPSKTYIVHTPLSIPEKPISRPGDIVTISVTHPYSKASQTISFIVGWKQVLPWLEQMATNIPVSATVTLHDSSTQVVSLTLKSLTRPAQVSSETLGEQAEILRKDGNAIFKCSENDFQSYKAAILHYGKAADRYRLSDHKSEFSAKMYSNVALASLRICEDTAALSYTDAAESLSKKDAKVLYRRALAYIEFDHPVRALSELNDAASFCPKDPLIKRERDRISAEFLKLLATRRQHFAEVYNVMLQSPIFKQPLLE